MKRLALLAPSANRPLIGVGLALLAMALWLRVRVTFRPYEPEPESITFAGGGW